MIPRYNSTHNSTFLFILCISDFGSPRVDRPLRLVLIYVFYPLQSHKFYTRFLSSIGVQSSPPLVTSFLLFCLVLNPFRHFLFTFPPGLKIDTDRGWFYICSFPDPDVASRGYELYHGPYRLLKTYKPFTYPYLNLSSCYTYTLLVLRRTNLVYPISHYSLLRFI